MRCGHVCATLVSDAPRVMTGQMGGGGPQSAALTVCARRQKSLHYDQAYHKDGDLRINFHITLAAEGQGFLPAHKVNAS